MTFISIELANKAFSYLLIAINIIEIIITALSTNAKLRYTLTIFIDIIIDINALGKSIANYK